MNSFNRVFSIISKLKLIILESQNLGSIILALSVALSTLWFMQPFSFYIFGQDSYSFLHPFYYSINPFYSYNNNVEGIFTSLLISLLSKAVQYPQALERLLAVIGVFTSLLGLSDLIKLLKKIGGVNHVSPFLMLVPMIFYVYNPYTLTVSWPHFTFWSISLIVAPFIISFFTYTIFYGFGFRRFAFTSLVLIFFAGTISGSMLPFLLVISLVAFILTGLLNILKRNSIRNLLKSEISIVAFVLITTMYTFIPLYFSAVYSTPASYSHSFVLKYFLSESSSTSLLNVLTMLGYNQVFPGSTSYPWIGSLSQIYVFSLILIIIVFIRIIVKGIEKQLTLLGVTAFLSVVFSTGSNFPFGFINEKLVLLGGPFLFLVNAYYFTIQYYVLFLSVIIFYIMNDISRFVEERKKSVNGKWKKNNLMRSESGRLFLIVVVVFTLIFIVLITPFAYGQVYQTQGDNIDEVNINNGLMELNHFLEHGQRNPEFLSILLPLSSFPGRTDLQYGNASFVDSTGIIKSIDPYPLIWNDNSYLASSIENYFSAGNFNNLALIMTFLHIKFIIFTNSYSHLQYMECSPNGKNYNMTAIFSALSSNFGNPLNFGSYYLFINNNSTPIASIVSNPYLINDSLSNFLDFLGGINLSTAPCFFTSNLQSTILLTTPILKPNVDIYNYNGMIENISHKSGNIMFFTKNGNETNLPSSYFKNESNFILIHPKVLGSLDTLNYTTNMIKVNGTLFGNSNGSYLLMNNTFRSMDGFKIIFIPMFSNLSQVLYFHFSFGNVSGNFFLMNFHSFLDFGYSFNFPSLGYYAWGNKAINANVNNHTMILNITDEPNQTITGNLNVPYFDTHIPFNASYGPTNFIKDLGYQEGNYLVGNKIPNNFTFSISSSQGMSVILDSVSAYRIPNLKFILEGNLSDHSKYIPSNLTIGNYGGIHINGINQSISNNSYVYFFNPPTISLWQTKIIGATYTMVQPDNFSLIVPIPHNKGLDISEVHIFYVSIDPYFGILGILEFIVLASILFAHTVPFYIKKFRRRET